MNEFATIFKETSARITSAFRLLIKYQFLTMWKKILRLVLGHNYVGNFILDVLSTVMKKVIFMLNT